MSKLTRDQQAAVIDLYFNPRLHEVAPGVRQRVKLSYRRLSVMFNVAISEIRQAVNRGNQMRGPARPGWQPHLEIEEPPGYNYLDPWLEGEP